MSKALADERALKDVNKANKPMNVSVASRFDSVESDVGQVMSAVEDISAKISEFQSSIEQSIDKERVEALQ